MKPGTDRHQVLSRGLLAYSCLLLALVADPLFPNDANATSVLIKVPGTRANPVPPAGAAEFLFYGGDGGLLHLNQIHNRLFYKDVLKKKPVTRPGTGNKVKAESRKRDNAVPDGKTSKSSGQQVEKGSKEKAGVKANKDDKAKKEHNKAESSWKNLDVSLDGNYSNHYGLLLLSGIYRYNPNIAVELNIPLLTTSQTLDSGSSARAYGIGDVSAGLSYRFKLSGLNLLAGGLVSFPSGDDSRVVQGSFTPTGNGTYGFIIYLAGAGMLDWGRIHGFLAYRGMGSASIEQPGGVKVSQSSGGQFAASLALDSDRLLKGIRLGARLTASYSLEGTTKIDYPGSPGVEISSRDGLFMLDAWLFAEYEYSRNLSFTVSASAPLATKWTGNVNPVHYRDYFFGVGLKYNM
ncbi:MAG: hypothetical protein GXP49_13890 [Deltaproteobacteria bacterium]|nr:hypothetical protein [Deltaproteobacteria bacterium]